MTVRIDVALDNNSEAGPVPVVEDISERQNTPSFFICLEQPAFPRLRGKSGLVSVHADRAVVIRYSRCQQHRRCWAKRLCR